MTLKIKHIGILEVCDIAPSKNVALISIREPGSGKNLYTQTHFAGKELKLQPGWKDICILEFTDISRIIKPYIHFNEKHASEIIEFVDKMKNKNIIVHCHAGVSRSAAVALFISERYGHRLIHDIGGYNKFIYNILSAKKYKKIICKRHKSS